MTACTVAWGAYVWIISGSCMLDMRICTCVLSKGARCGFKDNIGLRMATFMRPFAARGA